MSKNIHENLSGRNHYLSIILTLIAIGIWLNVLQSAGVIPYIGEETQKVYVVGGEVDVDGSVSIWGGVEVENEVDVNISSVDGYGVVTYRGYEGNLSVVSP